MSKNKFGDIEIIGARMHNLKNVNLTIRRNSFTVFTGLSGSGKSSLAFDTLFAEGQRRYVESLSAYARQFLGKIEKPAVDQINGISPAIAIEQKVSSKNPRSTVGTVTEIYDYLKLLYARIGITYSRDTDEVVKKHDYHDVLNYLDTLREGEPYFILAKSVVKGSAELWIQSLKVKGFSRILFEGQPERLENFKVPKKINEADIFLLLDRFEHGERDKDTENRLVDAIQTAFYEGHGKCTVYLTDQKRFMHFNSDFEHNGITYPEPSVHLFSFNNPIGACTECEGFGSVIGIDPDLVVPDKSLSVYEGAVACWKGDKMSEWLERFVLKADGFPIHKPYSSLSEEHLEVLWKGDKGVKGIDAFFRFLEKNSYKIQYRVMMSRYRGKTICPVCNGSRLTEDSKFIRVGDVNIRQVVDLPLHQVLQFITDLKLTDQEKQITRRILTELSNRLQYLLDVGLGYLTLNRASNTLSGGESQRIQLATSLGSSLVGSMYILDEPSVGLHPRDTERLIKVLKNLNALGNTLIVVEHDEDIIRVADEIVDLGPEAGMNGGTVVFQGDGKALLKGHSLTSEYLNGQRVIPIPEKRRKWRNAISIKDAYAHNLKHVNVKIPLQVFTCVTGVSGSGKSSLIKDVLYKGLYQKIVNNTWGTGKYEKIEGDLNLVKQVEMIDQNPIGKSSRSNPVTYLKAYDEIRSLYTNLPIAKSRGLKPSDFSFNVDGGRCDTCKGEGEITVEMQFMSDIRLTCDECQGRRFKDDILEITFLEKSISDILDMTVDEAVRFFSDSEKGTNHCRKIVDKLGLLQEVGLGYVKLGQSSSTLSGGEAQRVKLASFLARKTQEESILFLFDEPSTGLHFHDILKLLDSMNALVKRGHSVVVIEHHLDIIKAADWVIDIGPEGGQEGGYIVFEGVPEDLLKIKESHTARFLKSKFN